MDILQVSIVRNESGDYNFIYDNKPLCVVARFIGLFDIAIRMLFLLNPKKACWEFQRLLSN